MWPRQTWVMRMEVSDEDLVAQSLGGDAQAFGVLISRNYDRIYRLGFTMLGAKGDAEDLAQDICAALPAKLKGFRGEARFTTWLHRVVLNAAKDVLRKRATRARASTGWGDVEILRRETASEQRAELEWLHGAMAKLDEDLRETVALVLGEDMTHAQAAGALGLSEGTVSWRMSEVRKELRRIAKEEEMLG